ncbi:MAG: hypothetical protein ACYSUV_08825 [Planctomycetota bacterium]|jgi:hypothetical protein
MLASKIQKSRQLRPSSLKSYASSLRQIRKMVDPKYDGEPLKDCQFLKDVNAVKSALADLPLTSRKNKLTAALVGMQACKMDKELIEEYQTALKEAAEEYNTFLSKQQKTKAQKANWISADDLRSTLRTLISKTKTYIKRDELTSEEFDLLQQRVILSTYLVFPLRNDFADMRFLTKEDFGKIPDAEKAENNYLVKSGRKFAFHLNQFKNVGKLGARIMPVDDRELAILLTSWWKFNQSGWFMTLKNRTTPMSPNALTKYLQKIFKHTGKKISSSMIRHILISEEMKDQPTIKEQEKRSDRFLHSKGVHAIYRKVE